MFEESPFSGACGFAFWEVLVMLLGTLALGVLLGFLIWGWTRRKLLQTTEQLKETAASRDEIAKTLDEAHLVNNQQGEEIRNLQAEIEELKAASLKQKETEPVPSQTAPLSSAERWDVFSPVEPPIEHEAPSTDELVAASDIMGQTIEFNDLTIIEGIDQAVADVLHKSGISSWALLGGTTKHILRVVLDEAGPQMRRLKPKTWPRQAQMAHNGEWKKLKTFQDVVRNSRKK